ncbi:hypothetical protein K470DRAFT_274969 [Piedraia hortae CBS 480.64]|uniref:Nuclear segregation protein n=1 Tax=Piedraia hortae CBS 480.64 TaxID=1314780 RepID=A0A6A7C7G8_9PEZI|nr:hypothetical protein K470DRAFT_274969 [Piedraia hortae CBS 480.64]
MAEATTPSAIKMATMGAGTEIRKEKAAPVKPERPDEAQYKAELAKAEKEQRSAEEHLESLKLKLDNAHPSNKDSPVGRRQQQLRAELLQIRSQQQSSKSSRGQVLEKIKRLDDRMKEQLAKQKADRTKLPFKTIEAIEAEVARLQKDVDSGKMRLVDEKKALSDISQLNRQKKNLAALDEAKEGTDAMKSEIVSLRQSLDDPESKTLSDRYLAITTELDKIKADQDVAFKNLTALREERSKAFDDVQQKKVAVKSIKDKYFQARRAAMEYEREARRIRDEKRRAENEAYHRNKRQEAARAKLEEASAPAYQDELRIANNLLARFDPSSATKQEGPAPTKFAAPAARTVDGSDIKGRALKKKGEDDENYFVGGGGKKGKKRGNHAAAEGKFTLDPGTIDSLNRLGVDPPMSSADVPELVKKIKEKISFWKDDQERKTQENISKAKAEIDRLEIADAGRKAKENARDTKINREASSSPREDSPAVQKLLTAKQPAAFNGTEEPSTTGAEEHETENTTAEAHKVETNAS